MRHRGNYHHFNWRMLLRVAGWLLMIEAGFMLVPAVVGLAYGESDWIVFALTLAFTLGCGALISNRIKPESTKMGRREGFTLTASVWVIFSAFGMIPFIFCSTPQTVSVAFFEAMNGFTTTGSTALSGIESLSHAVTIWRALMQWIGGLGIILFTLAVLPMLNSAGGMQMFNAEVTGITHDKLRPRISQTSIELWKLYLILTSACALLLAVGPMDIFDAICHAFGTLSTGGFTTSDAGIDHWHSPYIKIIITVFMTLGGINFILIFKLMEGKFRLVWQNNTLRLYFALIAACTILFALSSLLQAGVKDAEGVTLDPLFRVVSTVTTAGYTVGSPASYGALTCCLMIPLIFFGGCAGSTSGGAKLDRGIVMGKFAANETRRALQPNSILAVKAGNNVLSIETVQKTLAFLIIFAGVIFLGGLALSAMGVPMSDALATALSATTNVGYNASTLGLSSAMTSIPAAGLWVLSLLMLIGRLEVFTIVVLLLPQFWRH